MIHCKCLAIDHFDVSFQCFFEFFSHRVVCINALDVQNQSLALFPLPNVKKFL